MAREKRGVGEFSMSFLDVICCGFGAIVLLLVITKTMEPVIIENSAIDLRARLAALQDQVFELRGETTILNRDLNAKVEQLSEYEQRIAILRGQLSSLRSRQDSLAVQTSSDDIVTTQLAVARQSLTEEMQRLLGQQYQPKNNLIGGIPVDSEYIIFVIDTSGSMFHYAWNRVLKELDAVLSIYPEVKGIQVLNDMGAYMFTRYRGQWIPDTPVRRRAIIDRLRTWNSFSNSSPVEGLNAAISQFYDPEKKISIFIFGDDFTGGSIRSVLETVDRLNARRGATDERMVRIHAVGFPVLFSVAQVPESALRFAHLMRELTYRNGGSFVGLNDFR